MESRAPAVVAVVVTTGSGPGLEATVASLAVQNYEELSLLVVANGETEHVPARVAAVAPNAFVRLLEENRGFAAACNEASLMVEGSAFFLFCHDDVRLEPDAIQMMVESAFRTNAGVVTPKVVSYDDPMVMLHVGQTSDRFGVVHERDPAGGDRPRTTGPRTRRLRRARRRHARAQRPLRDAARLRPVDHRARRGPRPLLARPDRRRAHRGRPRRPRSRTARRSPRASARSPRIGTRRASRQDLQRRHQLLVVATGWGRRYAFTTLFALFVMDSMEFVLAIVGRDSDRAGAILGSWRWLVAPPTPDPRAPSSASRDPGPLRRGAAPACRSGARVA